MSDKLSALYLNCTLKASPTVSHTDGLIEKSRKILEGEGIATEVVRPVDYKIALGVQPDMTDHGWDIDEWPKIFEKVMAADMLIITSPIWIGNMSSVATQVLERLYAHSGQTNDNGQYIYYNKIGAVLVTGNEDGGKHVCRDIMYGLQHLGYIIPPQADAYWVGEAGPGPSYMDEEADAQNNSFTNRNVRIATWNLIHLANMVKQSGGIPAIGNTVK